jgi:hypothetical protein
VPETRFECDPTRHEVQLASHTTALLWRLGRPIPLKAGQRRFSNPSDFVCTDAECCNVDALMGSDQGVPAFEVDRKIQTQLKRYYIAIYAILFPALNDVTGRHSKGAIEAQARFARPTRISGRG